jgi:hypothetical protein
MEQVEIAQQERKRILFEKYESESRDKRERKSSAEAELQSWHATRKD